MKQLVIVVALLAAAGGCKKKEASDDHKAAVPAMSDAEVKRNQDACASYVERVCACADKQPAVAQQCQLARSLPEALQLALQTALSPDSKPDIVQQAYASVRKTAKECIEQTAKLPTLGCP